VSGTHQLYLFIDGLARFCRSANRDLAQSTRQTLQPLAQIACRTAEWPIALEEELRRLWGKEAVEAYELTPLRREDVLEAARSEGLADGNVFLAEVSRQGVVPLAAKPVTLAMLLNIYARHGHFGGTQSAVYAEGCRLLCEETNQGRRAAGMVGSLSAEQRLVIAGRIAAVTILGNRPAVWTDVDYGDARQRFSPARWSAAPRPGISASVGEQQLREALGAGLFRAVRAAWVGHIKPTGSSWPRAISPAADGRAASCSACSAMRMAGTAAARDGRLAGRHGPADLPGGHAQRTRGAAVR
jgi:hypothetical protein